MKVRTHAVALTLLAALAACDSPTSVAAPLQRTVTSASANGGKPEVELCQAHWQELQTWEGAPFRNVGDCVRYSATGGTYAGTPLIQLVGYTLACPMVQASITFINGTGVIDYGTGPQPYSSGEPFLISLTSPPQVTLTVTGQFGQTASLQFTPSFPFWTCS